jgi:hypothetical protein
MNCIGFASHISKGEIYVGKYKLTNLFTRNLERYRSMLEVLHIPQEEQIKTVWKNFSHNTPGECGLITHEEKTVYDVIDDLLQNGLYLAKRREEQAIYSQRTRRTRFNRERRL